MEIYKTLTVFHTEMECPRCKNGEMQSTGMIAAGEDTKILHICRMCGFKDAYDKQYPSNIVLKESECLRVDAQ